jgi:hypothetical protein
VWLAANFVSGGEKRVQVARMRPEILSAVSPVSPQRH